MPATIENPVFGSKTTDINNSDSRSELSRFEKVIERWSERNIEEIRNETIEERRIIVEKKEGAFRIISKFPFIGRGNVLRDKVKSHKEIERELDDVLG